MVVCVIQKHAEAVKLHFILHDYPRATRTCKLYQTCCIVLSILCSFLLVLNDLLKLNNLLVSLTARVQRCWKPRLAALFVTSLTWWICSFYWAQIIYTCWELYNCWIVREKHYITDTRIKMFTNEVCYYILIFAKAFMLTGIWRKD